VIWAHLEFLANLERPDRWVSWEHLEFLVRRELLDPLDPLDQLDLLELLEAERRNTNPNMDKNNRTEITEMDKNLLSTIPTVETAMEMAVTAMEMAVTAMEMAVTLMEMVETPTEMAVTAMEMAVTAMEMAETPTEMAETPTEMAETVMETPETMETVMETAGTPMVEFPLLLPLPPLPTEMAGTATVELPLVRPAATEMAEMGIMQIVTETDRKVIHTIPTEMAEIVMEMAETVMVNPALVQTATEMAEMGITETTWEMVLLGVAWVWVWEWEWAMTTGIPAKTIKDHKVTSRETENLGVSRTFCAYLKCENGMNSLNYLFFPATTPSKVCSNHLMASVLVTRWDRPILDLVCLLLDTLKPGLCKTMKKSMP